ncbi:DUF2911 domain-containing protein [Reichenbachiella versicolor]|uniref:DUF2911 domain-containing protein n=1 Tax=Reichenbachiella versicolor TaxID=1821036 RepID=UPI000D6E379F|nr:DUF2911 domain-containing protein [Reichenbachiella versicolor]
MIEKIGLKRVMFLLVSMSLSGCFSPSYSDKYVSSDPSEFKQYQQETKDRPSPAARENLKFGKSKVYLTYSQPGVKGRTIWGDLVKYDEIWRTGANEATVLSSDTDLLVQGDTLKAGNYALYTIPGRLKWTVILNKKYDVWGAYDYDITKDALRFEVYSYRLDKTEERMKFFIDDTGEVKFAWENIGFKFYIMPI